jgi:hypothetical protein
MRTKARQALKNGTKSGKKIEGEGRRGLRKGNEKVKERGEGGKEASWRVARGSAARGQEGKREKKIITRSRVCACCCSPSVSPVDTQASHYFHETGHPCLYSPGHSLALMTLARG